MTTKKRNKLDHMMFLPVDLAHDDEDYVLHPHGEIHVTDDAKGRLYIDAGGHSIGIDIEDLFIFIKNEMLGRVL